MVVWNTVTITSQCCRRQHIHGHARHKADVIGDALRNEVPACAQRSAKAFLLAHPVCVAQQRPGAPQGKHHRAKQIPQQPRRPGKGHGCNIFQQISAHLQQTLQPVLQSPALQPAFDNVVPALFGAMAYQYYRKNIVVAIAPLVVMSVLFTLVPGLISSTSFMIIPSGALAIGIAYTIYKKKKASKEAQV